MISAQEIRSLLGRRIQFYRKQRQLSQATLAEKVDISITSLSQIERGIRYPTSETLSAIANALEVEVGELFRDGEVPVEQGKLLERFKNDVQKSVDTVYAAYMPDSGKLEP
jgi:transcriptional regulator with XRE-family HTH domain